MENGARRGKLVLWLAAAALVVVAGAVILGPALMRTDARAGIPAPGGTGVVVGGSLGVTMSGERGVMSFSRPVDIDGQRGWEDFPVVLDGDTRVRVSSGAIVPLRSASYVDGEFVGQTSYLSYGSALRVIVSRTGERLYAVRVEPVAQKDLRSATRRVGSIGQVDFSAESTLTGLVQGWGAWGDQGETVETELDFQARDTGLPVWLKFKVVIPAGAALYFDGKRVARSKRGLAASRQAFAERALGERVTMKVGIGKWGLTASSVRGTSEEYTGPFPGDVSSLEHELEDESPEEAERTASRRLAAGQKIEMGNGLTFTVPKAWEGTLTTYPPGSEGGAFGTPGVSEYAILHTTGAHTHPSSVMLESRSGESPVLPKGYPMGLDEVARGRRVTVWAGRADFPKPPYRLFVAETRLQGAERGVIYFGGSSKDPARSIREMWSLIRLEGVVPPAR